MNTTFDLPNSNLALTDFPYESGVLTILSPIGTTVYTNSDYNAPDFTSYGDTFTTALPISPTNGQPILGTYSISVTKAIAPHDNTLYTAKLVSTVEYTASIGVYQNCDNLTAIVNYTSNIPIGATLTSIEWGITDPLGNVTTETTAQFTIDPIQSGSYQIGLTLLFYVTEEIGGNEVSVKHRAYASYLYKNTCGNAQSILCNTMYCCVKTAFYEFLTSPTTVNLYALVAKGMAALLIQIAIGCGKQTDAQEILDKLNSSPYPCPSCGCGCND